MMTRAAVVQEDPYGCSVACVAFLCGISYGKARHNFKNPRRAKTWGFTCREIVSALGKLDKKYAYRRIRERIKPPRDSIIFIARSKKYPAGHFLARMNGGWMDPWINFPSSKRRAGFRKRLPGKAIYRIFPVGTIRE